MSALASCALRGSLLHVRLLEPAEKTSGGIYLPESLQENFSEAEVLAAGPGVLGADGERWKPWPQPGDTICFRKHDFQACGEEREGTIDAEKVLGITLADGGLKPLGEWVAVRPEARETESRGGVSLAGIRQWWRQKGTVTGHGPGVLILEDGCPVKRQSVEEILNWPKDIPLLGADVYWVRNATVLQVGREIVEAWLIRADDLFAYEDLEAL